MGRGWGGAHGSNFKATFWRNRLTSAISEGWWGENSPPSWGEIAPCCLTGGAATLRTAAAWPRPTYSPSSRGRPRRQREPAISFATPKGPAKAASTAEDAENGGPNFWDVEAFCAPAPASARYAGPAEWTQGRGPRERPGRVPRGRSGGNRYRIRAFAGVAGVRGRATRRSRGAAWRGRVRMPRFPRYRIAGGTVGSPPSHGARERYPAEKPIFLYRKGAKHRSAFRGLPPVLHLGSFLARKCAKMRPLSSHETRYNGGESGA